MDLLKASPQFRGTETAAAGELELGGALTFFEGGASAVDIEAVFGLTPSSELNLMTSSRFTDSTQNEPAHRAAAELKSRFLEETSRLPSLAVSVAAETPIDGDSHSVESKLIAIASKHMGWAIVGSEFGLQAAAERNSPTIYEFVGAVSVARTLALGWAGFASVDWTEGGTPTELLVGIATVVPYDGILDFEIGSPLDGSEPLSFAVTLTYGL